MFKELGSITFEPGKILVEGDFFFEEFVLLGRKAPGEEVRVKATEVLVYEDYQVTQLRLYFDRLTVARSSRGAWWRSGLSGRWSGRPFGVWRNGRGSPWAGECNAFSVGRRW